MYENNEAPYLSNNLTDSSSSSVGLINPGCARADTSGLFSSLPGVCKLTSYRDLIWGVDLPTETDMIPV